MGETFWYRLGIKFHSKKSFNWLIRKQRTVKKTIIFSYFFARACSETAEDNLPFYDLFLLSPLISPSLKFARGPAIGAAQFMPIKNWHGLVYNFTALLPRAMLQSGSHLVQIHNNDDDDNIYCNER